MNFDLGAQYLNNFDDEFQTVIEDMKKNNVIEIWNGKLYEKFRHDHFDLNPCIKCNVECDMPKIGEYFHEKTESGKRTNLIQIEKLFN